MYNTNVQQWYELANLLEVHSHTYKWYWQPIGMRDLRGNKNPL